MLFDLGRLVKTLMSDESMSIRKIGDRVHLTYKKLSHNSDLNAIQNDRYNSLDLQTLIKIVRGSNPTFVFYFLFSFFFEECELSYLTGNVFLYIACLANECISCDAMASQTLYRYSAYSECP